GVSRLLLGGNLRGVIKRRGEAGSPLAGGADLEFLVDDSAFWAREILARGHVVPADTVARREVERQAASFTERFKFGIIGKPDRRRVIIAFKKQVSDKFRH